MVGVFGVWVRGGRGGSGFWGWWGTEFLKPALVSG